MPKKDREYEVVVAFKKKPILYKKFKAFNLPEAKKVAKEATKLAAWIDPKKIRVILWDVKSSDNCRI